MAGRKTRRPGKDPLKGVDITNAFDRPVRVVAWVVDTSSRHVFVKNSGPLHVVRPVGGLSEEHGGGEYLLVVPVHSTGEPLGEVVHPGQRAFLPARPDFEPQRFAVPDELRHLFDDGGDEDEDGVQPVIAVLAPMSGIDGHLSDFVSAGYLQGTLRHLVEDTGLADVVKRSGWRPPSIAMPGLPDDGPIVGLPAVERYADIVGERVRELVGQYVSEHPGALASTPPELLAETLVDVAIDPQADRSELADLLAPLWSAKRTQEALGGLTRATMHDRRTSGSLLGVKTTDGDIFYPVAQFEAHEGKVRVKPDLRLFMMALRERDPWTVAVLLHTPADELGGLTPLDWVRRGRDASTLVAYAREVDAEFSR